MLSDQRVGSTPISETILWHDYETSGRDPRKDRPLQFAAIRTDLNLEEVEEPVSIRCRLPEDALPDPYACLVTRVVPGDFEGEEMPEHAFARQIHAAFSRPKTCVAGYNSIRFDDEFSRFLFWRNLLPVYEREYQNGNSRWDLIDPLRAAHALRPEGIQWPAHEDGSPSFRLEQLTQANGIDHGSAHDAVADVRATIVMARLLREQAGGFELSGGVGGEPVDFWEHVFSARWKREIVPLLEVGDASKLRPLFHATGKTPSRLGSATVVVPVVAHPEQPNQILCVDLRQDPKTLLDLTVEELRESLFTRSSERTEDSRARPGVKGVHRNRSPMLFDSKCLGELPEVWGRVQLDRDETRERAKFVQEHCGAIASRLAGIFASSDHRSSVDEAEALYDGFVEGSDRRAIMRFASERPADWSDEQWRGFENRFEDDRLRELAFRLRSVEAPQTLSAEERERSRARVVEALRDRVPELLGRLAELESTRGDDEDVAILARVRRLLQHRTPDLEP